MADIFQAFDVNTIQMAVNYIEEAILEGTEYEVIHISLETTIFRLVIKNPSNGDEKELVVNRNGVGLIQWYISIVYYVLTWNPFGDEAPIPQVNLSIVDDAGSVE